MAWQTKLSSVAERQLDKLNKKDPKTARRILAFVRDRVAQLDDPRDIGDALKGQHYAGHWKYRVGDYRVIANIQDDRLIILVVRVGHRSEVYRKFRR